jgi:DNA modification methylase
MKVDKVKINSIKTNPKNPRLIKDDKFKKLVNSIKEFPQMLELRPIVVDENNIILGGNMRHKACIEAGLKEVYIVQAKDLTEQQKDEFIVKDNVGFGEWDWDILANEWDTDKLTDWGLDLPLDLSVQELEAEEDDYEIPNEITTDIVLGDLFEIGEHRLLCGDSTDSDSVAKLMDGKKADMVFTSPPYNGNTTMYDYVMVNGKKKRKDKPLYEDNETDNKTSDDYIDFLHSVLNICFLNTYGYIFWNINYNAKSRFEFLESIYPYRHKLQESIIWKKNAIPTANGFTRNFEFIFMFKTNEELKHLNKEYDVTQNIWDINNSGSQTESHKACFPVALPAKAIGLNESTKLIFEPFTGSGTTMVASHQLKRKCYGMELDPKYCQVIIDRMKKLDPSLEIKRNGEILN